MAIKRQATVTVKSSICSIGDDGAPTGAPDVSNIREAGEISARDGITRISYVENTEGGKVECELLFKDGAVKLRRRGATQLDIELRPGERYNTVYSIPPYKFDMWIEADKVELSFDEEGAQAVLEYDMCIGGEERHAEMQITVKYI